MGSAKVVSGFLIAVAAVALACGGDGPAGITDPKIDDPKVDTTKKPVDTAAVNLAARIAATNALLGVIDDGFSALSQATSAGGAGGPGGSPPMFEEAGFRARATFATTPPASDAAKCTFADATMRWVCPDFKYPDSSVVTSWFQFLDTNGVAMKLFDTTTTVAIRRFVGRAGVVQTKFTNQNGTVTAVDTMANTDTLILTGIRGDPAKRKLNGKGTIKAVLVPPGSPTIHNSATTTTENFAFTPPPPPGSTVPPVHFPISGKVTAIVSGYSEDKPTQGSTTTQVTTYDGTKIAKLVITTQQGQLLRTCTWDMTTTNPPTCSVP